MAESHQHYPIRPLSIPGDFPSAESTPIFSLQTPLPPDSAVAATDSRSSQSSEATMSLRPISPPPPTRQELYASDPNSTVPLASIRKERRRTLASRPSSPSFEPSTSPTMPTTTASNPGSARWRAPSPTIPQEIVPVQPQPVRLSSMVRAPPDHLDTNLQ